MIHDLRLFIFMGVIAVLLSVGAFVSSRNYGKAIAHRNFIQQNYENGLTDKCRISLEAGAFDIGHIAMKRPNSLLFLVDGGWKDYPDLSVIWLNNQKVFGHYSKGNYYPKRSPRTEVTYFGFLKWDMMFIIQVLFSFMIVILTYNTISKEKELGTLRLVLSNSLPRYKVILGKVLAAFSVINVTLIIGILLELLVVVAIGKIPLESSVLPRIVFFYFVSSGYILLWVLLSVFVSCSFPRSTTCLVYLLLIWITLILIIPSMGKVFVDKAVGKIPSEAEIENVGTVLDNELMELWRSKKNTGYRGGPERSKDDGHLWERNSLLYINEFEERINRFQYSVSKKKIDQLRFLYNFASISPAFLYRRISEALTNNGVEREYRFLTSIQRYRKELMDTFKELDKRDKDSPHLAFLPRYMSQKPIDPGLIPRFKEIFPSSIDLLVESKWLIALFFIEVIALFLMCHISFLRYDPT